MTMGVPASIDVVLPTYNRAVLVPRAVETFLAARKPEGVSCRLIIVDNNSNDETREVSAEAVARLPDVIAYVFEARQGRHHALNTGITLSRADIVAFFDDDETLDEDWLVVIAREFADPDTQFIGGPYLARWLAPEPRWLPDNHDGVRGITKWGDERRRYGTTGFRGEVWGGNCAFRREVFVTAGLYSVEYMFNEDTELFERIKGRFTGYYVPDMKIHHDVPGRKLQKSYFRRWFFEHGVNEAMRETNKGSRAPVRTIGGVPAWTYRKRLELRRWSLCLTLFGREAGAFATELEARGLEGEAAGLRRRTIDGYVDRSGRRA